MRCRIGLVSQGLPNPKSFERVWYGFVEYISVHAHLFDIIPRARRLEFPLRIFSNFVCLRVSGLFQITNASLGVRTAAGRQHNSFEGSSTSRYVSLARFWTLYVPGFNFPSTKIDMGSSFGERCMAAGDGETLRVAWSSGHLLRTPATLSSCRSG